MIERYINVNIDKLYKNRDRDVNYNPKQIEKNLDLLKRNAMT